MFSVVVSYPENRSGWGKFPPLGGRSGGSLSRFTSKAAILSAEAGAQIFMCVGLERAVPRPGRSGLSPRAWVCRRGWQSPSSVQRSASGRGATLAAASLPP